MTTINGRKAKPASRPRTTSRTSRTVIALDRMADRPWFLPTISLFPLVDYILPVLPNQMLLIALSVLQSRRWWVFALVFVIATATGAWLTTYALQMAVGPALLETLFGGGPDAGAVSKTLLMVERNGLWALAALAMLPWPPRTGVIICALAGLPPLNIALAVATGRLVPAFAYAGVGAFAPHLLRRIGSVDRVLSEVADARLGLISGSRRKRGVVL